MIYLVKPCPVCMRVGKFSKRGTVCLKCTHAEYMRRYRAKHPEYVRAQSEQNRDYQKVYQAAYRAKKRIEKGAAHDDSATRVDANRGAVHAEKAAS